MDRRRGGRHDGAPHGRRVLLWLLPFVSLAEAKATDDDDLIVEFSIVDGRLANVRVP